MSEYIGDDVVLQKQIKLNYFVQQQGCKTGEHRHQSTHVSQKVEKRVHISFKRDNVKTLDEDRFH